MRDQTGHPLTDRTIRLIQSFKPEEIQIRRHDSPSPLAFIPGVARVRLRADGYTVESITLGVLMPTMPAAAGGRIEGNLVEYCETGTEGLIWALEDDQRLGFDALQIIEEGDRLTIQDQLGQRVWSGAIRCDRRAGWQSAFSTAC